MRFCNPKIKPLGLALLLALLPSMKPGTPQVHSLYQWSPIEGAVVETRFQLPGQSSGAVITRSQISPTGKFYLSLPDAATASRHYSELEASRINASRNKNCSMNTLKLQPARFLSASLQPTIALPNGTYPLNHVENPNGNTTYQYRYVFSKGPVTYQGKAVCKIASKEGNRDYVLQAQLKLKPGWNILAVKTELEGQKIRMTYLNKTPGGKAMWVAFN